MAPLKKDPSERTRKYSPETIEKMKAYKIKYNHENYKVLTLRLHKIDDKEVYDKIHNQDNATEYIKQLVRADIKKKSKKK